MKETLKNIIMCSMLVSALAACSASPQPESELTTSNTGSLEAETQFGALSASERVAGATVFVASEELRLRRTPEVTEENIAVSLRMNDAVQIVDPTTIGSNEFIAVKVVNPADPSIVDQVFYASAKYLNANQIPRLSPSQAANKNKYFVITNIATEIVRLYRRCEPGEGCVNKMIMEFKGTAGNDSKERRSDVGVFKTTQWVKFYEVPGKYSAYYRDNYPPLPNWSPRGSDKQKWMKGAPAGFSEKSRGAFGWYTVMIGPNHNGQWMHGTMGWGSDKEEFVRFQDSFVGFFADIFAALGSHGCTRMSNEAIAFMRQMLPVDATYIKVYAKEAVRDERRTGYDKTKAQWPYILTKLGAGKINTLHDLASRDDVLAAGTPRSEWLEEGTFEYDQYPDARKGDHYGVGKDKMQGFLLVDQGMVTADYRHPVSKKLAVGGANRTVLDTSTFPAFAVEGRAQAR